MTTAYFLFIEDAGRKVVVAGPYVSDQELEEDQHRIDLELDQVYPFSHFYTRVRGKVDDLGVIADLVSRIYRRAPFGVIERNIGHFTS